jgi:glycosyltransferase involved in cell wall biosynthesis
MAAMPEHPSGGPLRVLHAVDSLRMGGAQILIAGLLEELAHDPRLESHVLVTSARGAEDHLVDAVAERSATLTMIDSSRLADPSLIRQVFARVRQLRPGLIHSHLIDANVVTRLAALPLRVPHLTTIHIPPYPLADSGRARTAADGITARLSTKLVAVSRHAGDAYARAFRLDPGRIDVVANAALPRPPAAGFDRAKARASLGVGADTPLVLCLSRLEPHKGIADLIAAAAVLRDRGRAVRVVVAGAGPSEPELRRRVEEAGLEGGFELLGRREDVGELLAAADAFCLPSHHEGSPISLIEAMHAGLPCIGTEVGGVPELLAGERGLVVEPGVPIALADALDRVLGDPALAARLGDSGARAAASTYTPVAMAARYRSIYEQLAWAQ